MAQETHSPQDQDSRRAFDALANRVNNEISTYWARNNVLLAVNVGILVVGLTVISHDQLLTILIALLGIAAAVSWQIIIVRGRAWLYFWEDKLADVEKNLPEPHVFPGYWKKRRDRVQQGEPRQVTGIVSAIPVVLLAIWIIMIGRLFVQ